MAGDWLKFELETPEKPEVVAIASKLGVPRTQVIGCLILIWRWFSRHTIDGNAKVTLSALTEIVGVPGFPEAMVTVKWLSTSKEGNEMVVSVPDFYAHNGKSAKKRALGNLRKERWRNAKGTLEESPRQDESIYIPPKPPVNLELSERSKAFKQTQDDLGRIECKRCAFCTAEAVGQINGVDYCRTHADNAYDGTTPSMTKEDRTKKFVD